uniref:Uncharacterized protein n=1 Tax=Polytomella parva TaxID=51329 RepID=A0A7S0YA25_9CHLO|mmetsp:Transcript_12381/g.22157  ORF Transcript_12381/g.22157 Transcript_12381/m.22157 type:complete len:801 (+) Transcript_12381:76-2478(+)
MHGAFKVLAYDTASDGDGDYEDAAMHGNHRNKFGSDSDSDGYGQGGGGGDNHPGDFDGGDRIEDDVRSGFSGYSAGDTREGMGGSADYQRGKRLRRLMKLLNSATVMSSIHRYQKQCTTVACIVVILALISFIVMRVMLTRGASQVSSLTIAGTAGLMLHKVLIDVVAIDDIKQGFVSEGISFGTGNLSFWQDELITHVSLFKDNHVEAYQHVGTANIPEFTPYENLTLISIWNNLDFNQTTFYQKSIPPKITYEKVKLWSLGNRFIDNALTVYDYFEAWVTEGETVRSQDEFKGMMLNGLNELYRGYYDTMNALTVSAVREAERINTVQTILMALIGVVCAVITIIYMWFLLQQVQNHRYSLYNVFLAIPTVLVKSLANRSIAIGEEQNSESEEEEEDGGASHILAHTHMNLLENQMLQDSEAALELQRAQGSKWDQVRKLLNQFTGADRVKSQMSAQLKGKHHRKSKHKRMLIRNSYDSVIMILPFISWCVIMVALSAVGISRLSGTNSPLAIMNIVISIQMRLQRLVFLSVRSCSNYTSAEQHGFLQELHTELSAFSMEWDLLIHGANGSVSNNPHYYKETGLLQSSSATTLLFRYSGCLSALDAGDPLLSYVSCFPESDPFYMATTGGLGAALHRLLQSVSYLLRLPLSEMNLDNPHLKYIAGNAMGNVEAALKLLASGTSNSVKNVFDSVEQLHLISFVLVVVIVVGVTFLLLRIYTNRINNETQRIARMFTQLPAELDIETLVMFSVLPPSEAASAMIRFRKRVEAHNNQNDDFGDNENFGYHTGDSRSTLSTI